MTEADGYPNWKRELQCELQLMHLVTYGVERASVIAQRIRSVSENYNLLAYCGIDSRPQHGIYDISLIPQFGLAA
jgi:hypothetical protein